MLRKPDYHTGRFFLSPLLGCTARCSFCYIFSNPDYTHGQHINSFGPDQSVDWIASHTAFRKGRQGSIIAIGAWGDPFPPGRRDLHSATISWLRHSSRLGNPIQIMSRYSLPVQTMNEICDCQQFTNQILYSTSITTFRHWRDIERGTHDPLTRLNTLKYIGKLGIPTNVMIKPFIPGVTDSETRDFSEHLASANVKYCVVGTLQWNNLIVERLKSTDMYSHTDMGSTMQQTENEQILDCSSTDFLYAFPASQVDDFIGSLAASGINVFKKSACVTSHILHARNAELLFLHDTHKLCVKCGICDSPDTPAARSIAESYDKRGWRDQPS